LLISNKYDIYEIRKPEEEVLLEPSLIHEIYNRHSIHIDTNINSIHKTQYIPRYSNVDIEQLNETQKMIYYLVNHINPPSRTPTPSPRISPYNSALFDSNMMEYSRDIKANDTLRIDVSTDTMTDNSPFYNNSTLNSPISKDNSTINNENYVNTTDVSNNNNYLISPINTDDNNIYTSFPFIAWTTISISVVSFIGVYLFKKK
jgi:hypothetical protein